LCFIREQLSLIGPEHDRKAVSCFSREEHLAIRSYGESPSGESEYQSMEEGAEISFRQETTATVTPFDLSGASKVATHLHDSLPIIDFGLDPMIALSTCKNLKECRHVQTTLKDLSRPRTAKRTPFDDEISLTRKTVVYSPIKILRRSQSLPNFGMDEDDGSLPSLSPPKTLGPSPLSPLRIRTLLVGSSRLPRRPFEELNIPTI